jgi:hypothetical protein
MNKSIIVRNKNISVEFRKKKVAIINDDPLLTLVTKMPPTATDELVSAIKKEFQEQFKKEFKVTDASMAVEIWGHVFAEKFANAVKSIAPVKFVDDLAEKICLHCEVVNIGEKGNDNNRFIWDWLAPFKDIIAALLLKE